MFGDRTPRDEARAIVADAYARGVNFIDTADVYTKGASETMVGELIIGSRHDWVLATKLGNKMSDRVNEGHFSRSWMMREIEASLERLQTDFVDILYLHRDENGMDLEEPLRAGRYVARRENSLLGTFQFSRLAHCRSGTSGGSTWHASTRCVPALLQPAQPHARGRSVAGLPVLRYRRGPVQPHRARRSDGQVPTRAAA